MGTLTKKQRQEIYLKVATDFEPEMTFSSGFSICHSLMRALTNGFLYDYSSAVKLFPEFAMFKPDTMEGSHGKWWLSEDSGSRIICLLLCAEMCND